MRCAETPEDSQKQTWAVSLATVWHPLLCLFMDEEVDELGEGLEDLGIEIGVEFLYYSELCEIFWRI